MTCFCSERARAVYTLALASQAKMLVAYSARLVMAILGALSYKLLFWSDRDLSLAAVALVVLCAFCVAGILSDDMPLEAWCTAALAHVQAVLARVVS